MLGETIAISWGRDTTILMNHASDIDLIMRDVSGARRPDLKIIGPFPPVEISDEDRRLSAEAAAEDQKQAIESTNRWEQARREIRDAVKKSPAMERNQEIWEQLQQDLRSEFDSVPRILEALFSVANDCARLMQAGIQA